MQKTACCFIRPVINKFTASNFLWRNRVRSHGRNQRLEPYMKKFTRTVLRGGGDGNIIPLTRPWRRGQRYGTIIIDQERHVVLDLLPERTPESVQKWLEAHPEVEFVSRDRGGTYVEGASWGAPQATQIADRWHHLANLGDAVEEFLIRTHIRLVETPARAIPLK